MPLCRVDVPPMTSVSFPNCRIRISLQTSQSTYSLLIRRRPRKVLWWALKELWGKERAASVIYVRAAGGGRSSPHKAFIIGRHVALSSSCTGMDTLHVPPHTHGDTLHTPPHAHGETHCKLLHMHKGRHVAISSSCTWVDTLFAPPHTHGWTLCMLLLMHRDWTRYTLLLMHRGGHVASSSSCTGVDTLPAPPHAQGWTRCTLLLMHMGRHFAHSS